MFPQTWVPTYAFMSSMMADILGYDPSSGMRGVLNSVYTALFQQASPAPSKASTLLTQTEATYTGYARQAVTWFPTYLDALGPQAVNGANQFFAPTDSVSPNTISQIGLVTALTGGTLLLLAQLASPIGMNQVGNAFTYMPVVQLAFNGAYGGPLAWS